MVKRNSGKAGERPVKADVPAGKEAEYAARIRQYIQKKSRLIRALMIAMSAVFAALMLFIVIARAAELIQGQPAVFWAVAGVLGAAGEMDFGELKLRPGKDGKERTLAL